MSVSHPVSPTSVPSVFERVVVGIDSTRESLVAAAQARRLAGPNGRIEVVAVAETHLAAQAGFEALHAAGELLAATREELECAQEITEPDDVALLEGALPDVLIGEAKRRRASLVAVGEQPHRRLVARLLGGPDLAVLRGVTCSVLIARPG